MKSLYFPVIVRISNFQAVSIGTYIEIHLLNIPAPGNNLNAGWVFLKAFKVNGDLSKNSIIDESTATFG